MTDNPYVIALTAVRIIRVLRTSVEEQQSAAFEAIAEAGWKFLRLDDDGKVIEEWSPPA